MNRDGPHARLGGSTAYLITKSVTADYDWVFPARDRAGDLFEDYGFTEHRSTKDVTDLVRRQVTYRWKNNPLKGR